MDTGIATNKSLFPFLHWSFGVYKVLVGTLDIYRIAIDGNFWGVKFSRFSWIVVELKKIGAAQSRMLILKKFMYKTHDSPSMKILYVASLTAYIDIGLEFKVYSLPTRVHEKEFKARESQVSYQCSLFQYASCKKNLHV